MLPLLLVLVLLLLDGSPIFDRWFWWFWAAASVSFRLQIQQLFLSLVPLGLFRSLSSAASGCRLRWCLLCLLPCRISFTLLARCRCLICCLHCCCCFFSMILLTWVVGPACFIRLPIRPLLIPPRSTAGCRFCRCFCGAVFRPYIFVAAAAAAAALAFWGLMLL